MDFTKWVEDFHTKSYTYDAIFMDPLWGNDFV